MAFALTLLLMAAQTPDASAIDLLEKLRSCGFSKVTAARDAEIGGDLVARVADKDAEDAQLECAARVEIETGAILDLHEALRERYRTVLQPLIEAKFSDEVAQMQANARQWFIDRGYGDQIAGFATGKIDPAAVKPLIVHLCGAAAGEIVIVRPERIELRISANTDYDTAACVLRFMKASGQTAFGFIGNEYAGEVKPAKGNSD